MAGFSFRFVRVIPALVLVAPCLVDCYTPKCADSQTCPTVGGGDVSGSSGGPLSDASTPAEAGAGPVELSCKPRPDEDGTVVRDACGIFVATTGADDAAGTRDAPKATLAAALAAAKAGPRRVYVCPGTYEQALVVGEDVDGVQVFGGVSCARGAYDASERPVLRAVGPTLSIASLSAGTLVQDLVIEAAAATTPSGSSVAGFVSRSANVRLRGVTLRAGAGADGNEGGAAYEATSAPESRTGSGGSGAAGGAAKTCTCTLGGETIATTEGGAGGAGGTASTAERIGGDGKPSIMPSSPENATGAGGAGTCGSGGAGVRGSDGAAGADGRPGSRPGAVTATGWQAEASTIGDPGNVGQGGGGGAGISLSGGGGGGGCGGCPGGGGGAGQPGGSSFALLVFESFVNIEGSTLVADKGGRGGNGKPGSPGQSGGAAGAGGSGGCAAGAGGSGGRGGHGAGGNGGSSIALGYVGAAPMLDDATRDKLAPGTEGQGGDGGGATNGGLAGESAGLKALPAKGS